MTTTTTNPWDLKPLLEFQTHMLAAQLAKQDGGVYYVMWTDGVVNTWTERYNALPVALARMAVLAQLDDNRLMFAEGDAEEFWLVAGEWLDDRVTR